MPKTLASFVVLALALPIALAGGCARYEYDIVRPPESAGHVGAKVDRIFTRVPLEYRLLTVENRLVMRIYNHTDESMQLVGERSYAVDPNGESHPLRSLPIAAHSNIKLVLPPMRPVVEQRGPTFGIGVGTVIGDGRRYREGFSDPWDEGPRYLAVVDDDAFYWEWGGDGEVRLLLVFQRGNETLEHEFVIGRGKM